MSDTSEPAAILDYLVQLDVSGCDLNVCIASYIDKNEKTPVFQRLALKDSLTDQFRSVVANSLQAWRKQRTEQQLVLWPHLIESMPQPYEFEYIDLDMYENIKKQVEALAQPLIGLPVFTADEDIVAGIRFYVITVQPSVGEPINFFRTYTPKRELGRSHWFAAWLSDGHFDTVNKPTFLFDNHIDCFSAGRHMFVVQKSNFQAIFRFFETIAYAASETLTLIQQRIPIKHFDQFAEDCQGHLQKLVKLKNIAQQPYLGRISMSDIRKVISQLRLPIEIESVDGTEMIVYDRRDRWALLKLLDDDYVQALLSNTVYEASTKRPLS